MKAAFDLLNTFLERHPPMGYLAAVTSTGTGFWVLLDKITKVGAFVSIALGITLTLVTLQIQLRIRRDQRKNNKP